MAVRFVLGRAGAGKTQWCFEQIVASLQRAPLGSNIFWLLPRQATFQAERLLACGGPMGGYFGVRCVSFEDLGREILAECGGSAAMAEVSDPGRRMILGHLLRRERERLRFFKDVAHQPGVAGELDATFDELQRCGQDAAAVSQQLESGVLNPSLAAKLHDLSLIWTAYSAFLGKNRRDPEQRLNEALASIEKCESLRNADIFVDSFYEFTVYERRVLAALAKTCKSLSITLTLDTTSPLLADPHLNPDELGLFHRSEQAYRRLWFTFKEENLPVAAPVLLGQGRRFANPALAAIEQWKDSPTGIEAGAAIELIEAPDRRSEVDAAARWIGQRVAGGMRYRDIAVIMRTEEEYRDLIDASFREHGIPFFMDRRRTASHHPLLRLIRAAMLIARDTFPPDAMTMAIKTSLVGLSDDESDELENFVLQHGIRGTMWAMPQPWTGHRRRRGEGDELELESADVKKIDALRRKLVEGLTPFVKTVTATPTIHVRDLANAIFAMLEHFKVRAQIVQWMSLAESRGRLEERGEHERVWGEAVKLFDEMVDLFGEEQITLDDFVAVLDSALAGFDLALTPPTVDQVLVGAVDRSRTPRLKACVVLGLSEGQFPCSWREGTVFTDSDRRILIKRNIDLDPETEQRLLDEQFLGYIAFTRSSDQLLLTRPAADQDNRPTGASELWQRVQRQFPDLLPATPPREQDLPLEQISTPRQLIGSLMQKIRRSDVGDDWKSVYQWLAQRPPGTEPVDLMRDRAWKALSYHNDAKLDPARAQSMFSSPLNVSISQLESFAKCPYQHFARFGLALTERPERQVSGADLSKVYHDVLEQLLRQMLRSKLKWSDLNDEQIRAVITEWTNKLGAELRGELMLSTARNRYLLARIEKTLLAVAAAQKAAGERGDFVPAWVHVRFGPTTAGAPAPHLPPLSIQTPAGKQVLIRGKIDRVDCLPDGSVSAIDYRLSAKSPVASELYFGISLQLLTSLVLLEKNGSILAGKKLIPAAAFWVQLLRKVEKDDPQDCPAPNHPSFHLRVKPRGLFDIKYARHFDKSLETGVSEVVQLQIKKDGGIGRPQHADAAPGDQFNAMLRHIEKRIGETADRIIAGQIDIRPYRLNTTTPCPACEFRDLCRFEPAPGSYNELPPMNREQMLQRAMEK